ncbi:TPA: hypothetical protein MFL88_005463 [Klebsiella pneumoniae]|nr:hypothetical protein [Klebsiella pneumoniae]HBW8294237.1 hypothetical protein [Klebsiella pneumoniae]HBW8299721.1 hypothetical protein [Klebsiella pneumoniae]HBW8305383.1 hypothetical protein [Klebsiella pneumoniae]HBW8310733.1 hypothetical protein [Klebsiella pneumoniae]
MPENPASYRVVRTKSYLFNKASDCSKYGKYGMFHICHLDQIDDIICDDQLPVEVINKIQQLPLRLHQAHYSPADKEK